MDDLEVMRKEVELKYNVTLEKNDPLLAVMAVTLQLVAELHDQNVKNYKVLMNELQKLQAASAKGKSYPRLKPAAPQQVQEQARCG